MVLGNNWLALIVTFALSLAWLRLCDFIAHRGWIVSDLSRKIIHIGTGPIFVLSWLLFTNSNEARWLAALVPLAITAQFALVGLGLIRDPAAVKAMSRTGDRREVLHGPLYYGIVIVALTLIFWKNSPIGILALMLLCGGDGMADVIGKRIPSAPIPWSRRKTIAGSLAMFLGGWLLSVLVIGVYTIVGMLEGKVLTYLPAITFISLIGSLVESLPLNDLDNITVPAVAVALGILLF